MADAEIKENNYLYLNAYPAVGFYFKVSFGEANEDDGDSRFQSISGLTVEVETETRKEGGENKFEHTIPVRTKYPPLVLKKGLVQSGKFRTWCIDSINAITTVASKKQDQRLITPKDIIVTLLNPEGKELMSWKIVHAWPVKWSISDLNAEQSSIVIESIELKYQYFTITDKVKHAN